MNSSNSLDLNALTYNAIDSRYGWIKYNGIRLYVNAEKTMFCASRLTIALKAPNVYYKSGYKRTAWFPLTEAYPNLFEEVTKRKGTSLYYGWYASFELLPQIACLIEPVRGTAWFRGEPWQDNDMKGMLYLLQPPRWIGTNVFKIGETKDISRRLTGRDYGTGTQVLGTIKVTNRIQAETILIDYFKSHGGILREGREYFELAGLGEAQRLFTTAPLGNLYDRSFREVIELYRSGEWLQGQVVPDRASNVIAIEDDDELDDDVFVEA